MRAPRLTIRARLTLVYTALFAVCGAIVIAITYGLVASMPVAENKGTNLIVVDNPAEFLQRCQQALKSPDADPNLRYKCDTAFQQGIQTGAKSQRTATLDLLLRYSMITLIAVTVLAAFAGWIIAGRALRPVHQITSAARTASEHNLSARLALAGPRDELRELADTFDDMLGRLQAAFEGQQRFIANASHELRTPLTFMRASVDVVLAKTAPTPTEFRGMGHDIRRAVDNAEALIDALLTLASNEHGLTVCEEVDLATVTEDVLDSLDLGDRRPHESLQPAVMSGDPVLLTRLVTNLADNAVRYNVPGGDIWFATSIVDGQPTLVVTNTGPVIAPELIGSLFQPFRRLHDRTGAGGFGLGLAIVASIADVHAGAVTAQPVPGGGLQVTVAMPAP